MHIEFEPPGHEDEDMARKSRYEKRSVEERANAKDAGC
jgi:hypothetical protein